MTRYQTIALAALRLMLGWVMFYAGVVKIINPAWSAAGYLQNAKIFSGFFQWLASPSLLPAVNWLNEWGLTLLGVSIILGVFVRLSSLLGAGLILLYYFPVLEFPYIKPHSFIIDDHIIYAVAFLLLAAFRAGRYWGLENWCAGLPVCRRYPKLREWLG